MPIMVNFQKSNVIDLQKSIKDSIESRIKSLKSEYGLEYYYSFFILNKNKVFERIISKPENFRIETIPISKCNTKIVENYLTFYQEIKEKSQYYEIFFNEKSLYADKDEIGSINIFQKCKNGNIFVISVILKNINNRQHIKIEDLEEDDDIKNNLNTFQNKRFRKLVCVFFEKYFDDINYQIDSWHKERLSLIFFIDIKNSSLLVQKHQKYGFYFLKEFINNLCDDLQQYRVVINEIPGDGILAHIDFNKLENQRDLIIKIYDLINVTFDNSKKELIELAKKNDYPKNYLDDLESILNNKIAVKFAVTLDGLLDMPISSSSYYRPVLFGENLWTLDKKTKRYLKNNEGSSQNNSRKIYYFIDNRCNFAEILELFKIKYKNDLIKPIELS